MDNVVSIKTRKSFLAELEAKQENDERLLQMQEAGVEAHLADCLTLLDNVTNRVMQGKLNGLIIIAIDQTNGHFMTEVRMASPNITRQEMFSYIGVLETLKLEMTDQAQMAPTISAEGKIIDPFELPDEDEDDWEDYDE